MNAETLSLIQEAMGVILARKLMDCFDRPEDFSTIRSTNEFRILSELQDKIEVYYSGSKQENNIIFQSVSDMWNKFYVVSEDLTKQHVDLLDHIVEKLSVKVPDPSFLLGSVVKYERKIFPKIDKKFRGEFKSYAVKANVIIRDFRLELLAFQGACYVDEFFDESHVYEKRKVDFKSATFSGTTAYLDLNAVASILQDKKLHKKCLAAVKDEKIAFLRSSYVVEDISVSNALFVRELIESLQELTKDQMTAIEDKKIVFAREDIYDTFKRVNLLDNMTRKFESHRLISVIKHYHDYPEFRRGEALYNFIKDDPGKLFSKDGARYADALDFLALKFNSRPVVEELISSGRVSLSKDEDRISAVEQILEFCDFINFQTEAVKLSNAAKIASSYRDNCHVAHASVADYFVSDDEKLRARASFTYKVLGIPTEVITSKALSLQLDELGAAPAHSISGESGE